MNYIYPIDITPDKLLAGTNLSEDPTAAWTAGTYQVGDERHVVATHRVYRAARAGSSTISPELDSYTWVDVRPTNRQAPFDIYTSTAATSTSDITYVINARFCNSLAMYGLVGTEYVISIKDAVGGTVIYSKAGSLVEPSVGWFDYLFGGRVQISKLAFTDLPIRPAAEVTITIKNSSTNTRAVGMISLGTARFLAGAGGWGGTQWGASAEPVTYSFIKTEDDGTTTIVRRHKATNLRFTVNMPRQEADHAVLMLQDVLDVPVAWFATTEAGFDGLSTFGIASSAPVSYDNFGMASINGTIKGLI